MAESFLDLIFLIRDRPFVFLVGRQGLIFFQQLKLDFFNDKVKVFLLFFL